MDLLYREIAEKIRKKIAGGRYSVNSKLPSEADLSGELKVSRPTIKNAVRVLVNEGVLSCVPSVGSFILRKPGERIIIGYIAPDLSDPFHTDMISCVEKLTNEKGYGLTVAASGETVEEESRAVVRLVKNGAVGVLASRSLNIALEKSRFKIPLVWCGGIPADSENDRVTIDNKKGMLLLVEHLISLGVKKIGYVEAEKKSKFMSERGRELKNILADKIIKVRDEWFVCSDVSGEEGEHNLFERFLKNGLPEAIICYNDLTAAGIINAALENKISVPERLKITGFDNIGLSRFFKVPITTVNYKIAVIAEQALELLLKRISGSRENTVTAIIEPELIVRQSTKLLE
ncbi:MAG: hypothetical protein A2452_11315 [Candidatus Firestonebacteria bacterium RIFOXYC2_FULL_39_67]|nr:MAG: hypothetical protein A2536_10045 [Candidatus Firestonebacteria bacterium RIFOXYD2_FULL_39_29]OGF54535.1 MAG: hypothetical protein A2452_11315 [Candidatus Firestonebacteria bacterium RIFOXYC2_FULL_39_67]OGF57938.1 MAG: hypothetical protein A2497_04780 [Candidatus Firestonebacteria bacterium RifOxyC12_full_39_7]